MKTFTQTAIFLFRCFGLSVLGLLLFFPAYKGIWSAYLLLAIGIPLSVMLHRFIEREAAPLSGLPSGVSWLAALAAPTLVQLVLILWLRPEPAFDGLFVFQEAVFFFETGVMPPLTYYPPAQTWWYALWFRFFGASPLVAQISQIPLHAAVTLLTYGLARATIGSRARFAALLVAWYPSFVAYVLTTPYYHYLYTALVTATAWAWIASLRHPIHGFVGGLASGLGALTKATQLIAPVQAAVFWALACWPDRTGHGAFTEGVSDAGTPQSDRPPSAIGVRRIGALLLLFVMGMALMIGPWTLRNWRVFGTPVLVCTSGGLVLHSANNPQSNGLYSPVPDQTRVETPGEMLAHSRASADAAKQFIRENPWRFFQLMWIKVLHTWGGEATFAELINHRGRPLSRVGDAFKALFFLGWSVVVSLWAIRAWCRLRSCAPVTALEIAVAVVIGSNLVVYAVFEGGDRHHLPFVPLLIVLALSANPERSEFHRRAQRARRGNSEVGGRRSEV